MKCLVMVFLRLVFFTSTLNAVSMLGGESMGREPMKPIFDSSPLNVTGFAGDTVTLPCTVDNKDKDHKVIWLNPRKTLISTEDSRYIDDTRISVERPKVRNWNLMLREVRYNDSGEYMCQINTVPVLIKRIYLFIKVSPEFVDYSMHTKIRVRENELVELVCNATGVPVPVVTWYKQATLLLGYQDDSEEESTLQGEVLVLPNITRYCDGTYECNADNGVPPIASRMFEITVLFAPEVRFKTMRIGQAIGRETILECKVAASPHATIEWTRNGQTLPIHTIKYSTEIFDEDYHEKTLALNIINIEKDDFGFYTCRASNDLGVDSETMLLYEYSTVTETDPIETTTYRQPALIPPRQNKHRGHTITDSNPNYNQPGRNGGKFGQSVYTNNFSCARVDCSQVLLLVLAHVYVLLFS